MSDNLIRENFQVIRNESDGKHPAVVYSEFVVASCKASVLLRPPDPAFDDVAISIEFFVKVIDHACIHFVWNVGQDASFFCCLSNMS